MTALKNGSGPRNYLQAYLYRIAHNWITNPIAAHRPTALPLEGILLTDESANVQQAAFDSLEGQRAHAALAVLTPEQRQVVTLRYLEGWAQKEIAVALEKPLGAVKALQHRGIEALRRMLIGEEIV